jgi:nitrogen fixation protein FixH
MKTGAGGFREFTGRDMLAIAVAFFAAIVVANLALAVFASRSWPGLIVANGYVASQSFNRDAARARAQEELGWNVALTQGDGALSLRFARSSGAPIRGLAISGRLRRPVSDRGGRSVAFREIAGGDYGIEARLDAGVWEIDVTASREGEAEWRKTFRFVVR